MPTEGYGSVQRISSVSPLSFLLVRHITTLSSTSTYPQQWDMLIMPHTFDARTRRWSIWPIKSGPPLPTPPCILYQNSWTYLRLLMTIPTPGSSPPNLTCPSQRPSHLESLSPSSAMSTFMSIISSPYHREDMQTGTESAIISFTQLTRSSGTTRLDILHGKGLTHWRKFRRVMWSRHQRSA